MASPQGGALLVAFAASLWATDAMFRAELVGTYSPLSIVWTSHLICLVVTLPIVWRYRQQMQQLSWRSILLILYIACAGGALAMVLFTEAFSRTSNYTIPILIQKLQPLMALLLARIALGERPGPYFYLYAIGALFGAYLVSFEWNWTMGALQAGDPAAILYALAAAALWGSTTVAGRRLSGDLSSYVLTALRYVTATIFLTGWCLLVGETEHLESAAFAADLKVFIPMALGPGLFGLFIYYYGLKRTSAATATFCELAFPIGAIIVNWVFLDTALSWLQIGGAALLLICVTRMGPTVTGPRQGVTTGCQAPAVTV